MPRKVRAKGYRLTALADRKRKEAKKQLTVPKNYKKPKLQKCSQTQQPDSYNTEEETETASKMTMTQQFTQFLQIRPSVKPRRIDIPSYHAQALITPVPPPPGYGEVPAKTSKPPSQVKHEEIIENLPDFPSIKGIFGWTTVDQVNIPYILRHDKQFVSVRIVEMKVLSKYPNSYPDDLGKHTPLTSYFVTANEAKLLNEVNLAHCGGEYGKKEFNTKDLIVLLSDFIAFFKLAKKYVSRWQQH